MTKASTVNYLHPKNPDIQRILDQLTRYPVVDADQRLMQDIGRHKTVRRMKKSGLRINKGRISIPYNIVVKKDGNGYKFEFR